MVLWWTACVGVGPDTSIERPEDTAEAAVTPAPDLNVVVVLVDTLRADHLSLYGRSVENAPELDAWASGGMVFEQAVSQNGWTVPSVASLFTSLYTGCHDALFFDDNARIDGDELRSGLDTLAEVFDAAGYDTAALLKSVVITEERGFAQGFDTFESVAGYRDWNTSAEELTDAALSWLEERDQDPFFLYLHYMDPHSSYWAPEPYYELFDQGTGSSVTGEHTQVTAFKAGTESFDDADLERLHALYDGEIAYLDSQLGRLFGQLEALGHAEDTLVVLTADHGEAFYEHQNWLHEHLFQENVHVPLAIVGPGVTSGRVAGWVQVMDVAPTVVSQAGLDVPESWAGRDLGSALVGGEVPGGAVYTQYTENWAMIRQDGIKGYFTASSGVLYDLEADPGETTNIRDDHEATYDELWSAVDAINVACQAFSDAVDG